MKVAVPAIMSYGPDLAASLIRKATSSYAFATRDASLMPQKALKAAAATIANLPVIQSDQPKYKLGPSVSVSRPDLPRVETDLYNDESQLSSLPKTDFPIPAGTGGMAARFLQLTHKIVELIGHLRSAQAEKSAMNQVFPLTRFSKETQMIQSGPNVEGRQPVVFVVDTPDHLIGVYGKDFYKPVLQTGVIAFYLPHYTDMALATPNPISFTVAVNNVLKMESDLPAQCARDILQHSDESCPTRPHTATRPFSHHPISPTAMVARLVWPKPLTLTLDCHNFLETVKLPSVSVLVAPLACRLYVASTLLYSSDMYGRPINSSDFRVIVALDTPTVSQRFTFSLPTLSHFGLALALLLIIVIIVLSLGVCGFIRLYKSDYDCKMARQDLLLLEDQARDESEPI